MLRLIARVHGALIAALMAAALLATAWPAGAQEQVRAVFDIPAQSLSGALVEYSRQSGVVVVVPASLVAGKRAPAVRGVLTAEAALERLLSGSGLEARRRPEGGLTLAPEGGQSLPAAAPPGGGSPEIVVTGVRLREVAQAYAGAIALATAAADQYPRWSFRLCPSVAGLAEVDAQALIDHIARRAFEVGVRVERAGCQPNVVIIFAPDGDRLAREIADSRRDLLGHYSADDTITAGRSALEDFVNVPRAVRWWHVSRTVGADGEALGDSNARSTPPTAENGAPLGAGPPGSSVTFDGVDAVRSPGTRMRRSTRQELSFVLVIVDSRRTAGAPTQALADYLAMSALVRLDPDADMSAFSSILNLFAARPADEPPPVAMTVWDLAYLQGLYRAPREAPNARQQQIEIARRMVEHVASE